MKAVAPLCDVLLVVGSQNSSNSRRLVEVCEKEGVPAYLVDNAHEVNPTWLEGAATVAVTAGASAPEVLVQELARLAQAAFRVRHDSKRSNSRKRTFVSNCPEGLEQSAIRLTQITQPEIRA